MKKIFLFVFAMLLAGVAVNAQTAKDVKNLRIYLNPGHGSWGPNDRPMATIPYPALMETGRPDTCGFYESNTNLWKTQYLAKRLIANGFQKKNIVHSRTQNGPYPYVNGAPNAEKYNRNLTEICEEVEAGNFDMFLSVHSNAAGDGVIANYPLLIYRGYDNTTGLAPGSREMCQAIWPYIYNNGIDHMTYYQNSTNIRGDIDFYHTSITHTLSNGKSYTGYLGVLRHGTPGLLSEGYFHTYHPARHRGLNRDFCGQEGVRYLRGILKYFNLPAENVGYIMGTVKDQKNRISHDLYKYAEGTNDQWFPINGAKVTLYKDGEKVDEYTVDNNYNGVFVFSELEPGEYTIDCSSPNYNAMAATYKKVVVKANETTYPKVLLNPKSGYVPSISGDPMEMDAQVSYAYDVRHRESNGEHTFTFRSSGEAVAATIVLTDTLTNAEKTFPVADVKKGLNTLKVPEGDIGYGAYSWAVKLESKPVDKAKTFFRLSNAPSGSGVAVNTNPASSYFGQVYFADSYSTHGIAVLNPDLSNKTASPIFTSEFQGGTAYSPGRLAINPNNNYVYIADWTDGHSGIFYFSPAILTRLNTFFKGVREESGRILAGDVAIGGSTSGIAFQGKGADTKLYAFEEDYPAADNNKLCRYDVGTASTWNKAPSGTYTSASNLMGNHNVSLAADDKGVWLSQQRNAGNNSANIPAFAYMKNNGSVAFNSGRNLTTHNGCTGGGLAFNKERTLLAVTNGNDAIEIYNVKWSVAGTPSLTRKETIQNGCGIISQMAFDYAGNLFVSARNSNFAIALPNDKPVVSTPASAIFAIEDPNSIGTVTNDASKVRATVNDGTLTVECPLTAKSVDIFSADGARVASLRPANGKAVTDSLVPGVYLVKVAGHTIKVSVE